jgi:excisionase family DNA binding protein
MSRLDGIAYRMPQTDYRTGEVAQITGLCTTTIQRAIGAGTLRTWRTPGGHNRITPAALADFMRSLGRTAEQLPAPTWRQR